MSGAAPRQGRFITLEGGEGAGKSTQLSLLAQALRERGLDVVETREPGGTEGAEAIRGLLLSGAADRWTPRSEALLFAAARSDHVAKVIRPALDRGAWVVCDRYIDSNRAYQSGASGLADEDLMTLHRIGSGGLMPDRTVLLTVPIAVAQARAAARDAGRADRFGARGQEYHMRVAQAFADYAAQEPGRFHVIDTSAPQPAVHAAIMAALADMLP
ncbi:MAG: dTMP kinase [Sphingobium sp. 32-64-5]|nr:MAG: dTMP kinase [Sphingobium sp. 32-64-5]